MIRFAKYLSILVIIYEFAPGPGLKMAAIAGEIHGRVLLCLPETNGGKHGLDYKTVPEYAGRR